MKKLIPALLALCLLLTSCGILSLEYKITDDTTKDLSIERPVTSYTEITPKPPVTLPSLDSAKDPEKLLSTLPDMDFVKKYFDQVTEESVAYFAIATVSDAPVFATADEIAGSSVAAALNAVEEKYNVDIVNMPYSADEFDAKMKESRLSGRYFADLLSLPQELAKTYATADYCKPVSSLPFINADAPYFVGDTFKYGGELTKYAVLTSASYLTRDLQCLYFDASAVSDEIYQKAIDGSLSWDYVISLMEKTGRGIGSHPYFEDVFRLSSGARYAKEGDQSVLKNSPYQAPANGTAADGLAIATWAVLDHVSDKNPLFRIDTLGNYAKYASESTRYGMIPLPSFDGSDTVGYVCHDKVNYFLCPSYTTTTEGAGIIISALGAAASQREAEVLLTLIRDNARDNGTLLVSHLLFASPAWDSEYAFSSGNDTLDAS